MITIRPATVNDSSILSVIAPQAFLESHGHSARPEELQTYIANKLSSDAFYQELTILENLYHIISVNGQVAGFSKIILSANHADIAENPVTKLERIYLLKTCYGIGAGEKLFDHNVRLSREHHQLGMWLHVWKENHRAIAFYRKHGFTVMGDYDFEISPTHFNPNHVMYLRY